MFHNPFGLIAFSAVVGVVVLHLFRRRFRAHLVGALFLWERRDESVRTGRTRETLHASPSFWCELLAAALLALVISAPRGCGGSARHLVAVLDSSASMSAVDPATGESAAARAAERLRSRLGELSARGRVTLVQSGRPPTMLAGPAARVPDALRALETWEPGAARHDLEPALVLAAQLAGDDDVWLLTDRPGLRERHPDVLVTAVGRPAANAAVTRVARVREHAAGVAHDRVFAGVQSFAATDRTVRGEWRLQDGSAESFALELAPGAIGQLGFDLPAGAGWVEVALEEDALALDNGARLLPAPVRELRLFSGLTAPLARRLGLRAAEDPEDSIDRWLSLVPDSRRAASAGEAHLVISDRVEPDTWSLVLASPGANRVDSSGPFLLEKDHPLLFGTTLEGLVWSYDPDFAAPGRGLVWAGQAALLADEQVSRDQRAVRLNVDTGRSTLWRSPDWPILLANLAEERRLELPGPRASNLIVGEPFLYSRPEPGRYTWRGPAGGGDVPLGDPLVVEGLDRPGEYELLRDGEPVAQFAVHFTDPAESDLRGNGTVGADEAPSDAQVRAELSLLQFGLLFAALALVLLDWWFLVRGRPALAAEKIGADA